MSTAPDFSTVFFSFPEQRRTFSPKFDVTETQTSYILEGELPGLEKSNLSIEFTDPVTLLIKGRVEKSYNNAPASEPKSRSRSPSPARSLKPTVEDVDDEDEPSSPKLAATKQPEKKTAGEQKKEFRHRQWVSERTIGAFQRTFTFPAGIDQEGVKAGLEHGVLRVEVPKKAHVARRIQVL